MSVHFVHLQHAMATMPLVVALKVVARATGRSRARCDARCASTPQTPIPLLVRAHCAPLSTTPAPPLPPSTSAAHIVAGSDDLYGYGAYDPVRGAPWGPGAAPGAPVPYSALVALFDRIERVDGRHATVGLAANFLRSVIALSPADLLPTLYLMNNTLAPAFEGLEIGMGDSLLMRAVSEATGRAPQDLKAALDARGDLGLVAEDLIAQNAVAATASVSAEATVRGVFAELKAVAVEAGKASQDKKVSRVKELLVLAARGHGAAPRYLVRSVQGSLRIGLAGQSVLIALAHAITLTGPPPRPLDRAAAASSMEADSNDTRLYGPASRGAGFPPVRLCPPRQGEPAVWWPAWEAELSAAERTLRRIYAQAPSFDALVPRLLHGGVASTASTGALVLGVPVSPMLSRAATGVADIFARFGARPFASEWKYDGERIQVHVLPSGAVKIFSRGSEDITIKYPDLGEAVLQAMRRLPLPTTAAAVDSVAAPPTGLPHVPVSSCILDGEVVAYDRAAGALLPFQVLSTRSRTSATLGNVIVDVVYLAFDLLLLDGAPLLDRSLRERRAAMLSALRLVPGRFAFAESRESTDADEIGGFLAEAVRGGCEGLMLKALTGPESAYEPSKRSLNWLKLKKDYLDGVGDSLDLVVVGAWRGKGRRAGLYGAFLLAALDEASGVFQSVCKVGTGFSDEALQRLAAELDARPGCVAAARPASLATGLEADVWFEPARSVVWEVKAADLSISPIHACANGTPGLDWRTPTAGIALRFPRFLHARDDKKPSDATTSGQVVAMFHAQSSRQQQSAAAASAPPPAAKAPAKRKPKAQSPRMIRVSVVPQ